MLQGLPLNAAGLDQMQLSAAQQHPIQTMVPQHQPVIPQPMGYMQPSQVAHNSSQTMMYGPPQPQKVPPQNERMILRSGTRAGVPVSMGSAVMPTSGHAGKQRYRQGSQDDISGNPGALYDGSR
ncbi:hypothetical protein GGI23_007577 [Coemansia sp. RSA 2559]|nr:hypothetical protein GGI23_007577 [Coemansia sp. RSA 2559]